MSDYPPPPPPTGPYGSQPPGTRTVPYPAELLDRFLARLIDGIGLGIVYGILASIFSALFLNGYFHSRGELFVFYFFLELSVTALALAYYVYFETSQGATFGKQLMKLKVVGPDGVSNPTVEQSLRRNAFQALGLLAIVPFVGSFIGGLLGLAAVIFIAVTINNDTVKRHGWHDEFAGGTTVLKVG